MQSLHEANSFFILGNKNLKFAKYITYNYNNFTKTKLYKVTANLEIIPRPNKVKHIYLFLGRT